MVVINSLHISSFGKLHDFDLQLDSSFNAIVEANSYGKSTIAMFIKSMLYGFEYKKVFDVDKDNNMYSPWVIAGQYGGSLDYTLEGVKYRITRVFGKSAGSEKVSHVRIDNNTPQQTDNIGERLFGINSESFFRSIYIPQEDISIANSSQLRSKLSSMVDGVGSNYEKANKILDEEIKKYKLLRGNGGKIYDNQLKLQSVRQNIMEAKRNSTQLEDNTARLSQLSQQLDDINSSVEQLTREQIKLSQSGISRQKTEAEVASSKQYNEAKYLLGRRDLDNVSEHINQINELRNQPKVVVKMKLWLRLVLAFILTGAITALAVTQNYWIMIALLLPALLLVFTRPTKVDNSPEIVKILSQYFAASDMDIDKCISQLYGISEHINMARSIVNCYVEPVLVDKSSQSRLNDVIEGLSRLNEAKMSTSQEIGRLNSSIESLSHCDSLVDLLEQQDRIIAVIDSYTARYNALVKAKETIKQAKDNMSSNYIPKLANGVSALVNVLTCGDINRIDINDNFDLFIHEHGMPHDLKYFSRGTRELVLFCARVVLSQLLFDGQVPLLIVDDTFVNVDDNRQQQIFKQLSSGQLGSQVIYMSCHQLPSNID